MSQFQADRIYEALEACDGSEEGDAHVDHVLSSVPYHEIECVLAESDALHDAVVYALAMWTPPNLKRPH
jgi:hypothetical protein